jgi:glycerate-2-kinase
MISRIFSLLLFLAVQTLQELSVAKAVEEADRKQAEADAVKSSSEGRPMVMVLLGKAVADFSTSATQQVSSSYQYHVLMPEI